MEIFKKKLELVEIKSLQEIYYLTSTLFSKKKEVKEIVYNSEQEIFIKKITPYIKEECVACVGFIEKEESKNNAKVKQLYEFFNEFNDIFGESSTSMLLKEVGFNNNHIKETIDSLNNVNNFFANFQIEELAQWNNKSYLQSVRTHKEVSEKKVELTEDFFKPLVSYFINNLSKDKKAEFLLKLDLFKKSGWAEYIVTKGENDKNSDIVKLNMLFEESKNNNLDLQKQKDFKTTFEKFFETIELGININEKGLNIATINSKATGLYSLANAGMPDGSVKGCPYLGKGDILYVGWATANTKKYAQNLQWFRHLEGIDFSIKMGRKGFEQFNHIDASIISLAINHDAEEIGFIKNELKVEEKRAFQILGETTEICKGLSVQNGRYKSLIEKISSISLIGSQTELSLVGKSEKEISNVLLNVVKNVNNTLKFNLNENNLSKLHKIKRDIYLTDFCNAIAYLSEMNKQDIEFKTFLKEDVSPTFIGLAKVYPEMSSHLMKTLSFSIMNVEGLMFDAINQIESNANIGFDKDYLQRGFFHFDEKVNNLNKYDKDIEIFIKDAFDEIRKPLFEIVSKSTGYAKLDKSKENAIAHMLKVENIPNKPMSIKEKNIKEIVSKFKNKKTANKCLEFFKDVQKGFPHLTLLSSLDEVKLTKKERLNKLLNITKIYEIQFGELDSSNKDDQAKIEKLKAIENMTNNVLKDIEVLESKTKKEIKKEIELFIDESIKENFMSKDLISEQINKFNFSSNLKEVFKEIINKRKNSNNKLI